MYDVTIYRHIVHALLLQSIDLLGVMKRLRVYYDTQVSHRTLLGFYIAFLNKKTALSEI